MNNSKLMIAVAAAALIAGTSGVLAQQQGGAPGNAPSGQMAPKSSGGGQATGQPAVPGAVHNGAAETKSGKNAAEERGEQSRPNRTGEAQPNRNRETTGQAPQNERRESQGNEQGQKRTERNKATNGATEERRLEQNRATEERRDNDRNRTTGQGAAPNRGNVSVNVTPEKRTQLHQVFIKERSAPRVDRVDFSLSVGAAVPRSVRFIPVPSTILEIEPSWRGYDYFMVADQIVIVDPRSMEIVAIIDA
jgi:hypothetical protein